MNTTAKIIIAVLTFLGIFLGIYSFIKANEADKVFLMLMEEQQISIRESERAKLLSEQASRSAAEAIESAAIAEMERERAKAAIDECERRRK